MNRRAFLLTGAAALALAAMPALAQAEAVPFQVFLEFWGKWIKAKETIPYNAPPEEVERMFAGNLTQNFGGFPIHFEGVTLTGTRSDFHRVYLLHSRAGRQAETAIWYGASV